MTAVVDEVGRGPALRRGRRRDARAEPPQVAQPGGHLAGRERALLDAQAATTAAADDASDSMPVDRQAVGDGDARPAALDGEELIAKRDRARRDLPTLGGCEVRGRRDCRVLLGAAPADGEGADGRRRCPEGYITHAYI